MTFKPWNLDVDDPPRILLDSHQVQLNGGHFCFQARHPLYAVDHVSSCHRHFRAHRHCFSIILLSRRKNGDKLFSRSLQVTCLFSLSTWRFFFFLDGAPVVNTTSHDAQLVTKKCLCRSQTESLPPDPILKWPVFSGILQVCLTYFLKRQIAPSARIISCQCRVSAFHLVQLLLFLKDVSGRL